MLEDLILWLIIGGAAFYCGRTAYRTLTGRRKGCGCECSEEKSPPPLQRELPDLTDGQDKSDRR